MYYFVDYLLIVIVIVMLLYSSLLVCITYTCIIYIASQCNLSMFFCCLDKLNYPYLFKLKLIKTVMFYACQFNLGN